MFACGGTLPSRPQGALPTEAELLSGRALFVEAVRADELPDRQLLDLDREMKAFALDATANFRSQHTRLRRLLGTMINSGLLSLDYQGEATLTARETFYARRGNCLAFTNLFVALAREAGLQATYQQVDIPEVWTGDGDLAMLNLHVNVLVRVDTPSFAGRTAPSGPNDYRDFVVDFNEARFQTLYTQRPVSDEYVEALFYNNLAVNAMRAGEIREAMVYFAKAIRAHQEVPAVWTNLGVLYARNRAPAYAESAYHQALRIDGSYNPAIGNLARLYEQRGEIALADAYRERIRRYQQRNPYYHFFVSERAFSEGHPDEALRSVDRAIRLHKEDHRFHLLRALILEQVGDHAGSRASLVLAREYATVAGLEDRFDRKLQGRY